MADEPPYLCWEAHHEDLTDKVTEELSDPGRLTLYFRRKEDKKAQFAKIFAECSEGHLNVFEVRISGD